MINRRNTLLDQGVNCITLLALGISNAPFISRDLRLKLFPFLILAMFFGLFISLHYQAGHSKEDIKREQEDERNQMILEKSVWYCYLAEDWIFLALFALFTLGLEQREIAYTVWWVMIGRSLLTFGIRWWLNRKY